MNPEISVLSWHGVIEARPRGPPAARAALVSLAYNRLTQVSGPRVTSLPSSDARRDGNLEGRTGRSLRNAGRGFALKAALAAERPSHTQRFTALPGQTRRTAGLKVCSRDHSHPAARVRTTRGRLPRCAPDASQKGGVSTHVQVSRGILVVWAPQRCTRMMLRDPRGGFGPPGDHNVAHGWCAGIRGAGSGHLATHDIAHGCAPAPAGRLRTTWRPTTSHTDGRRDPRGGFGPPGDPRHRTRMCSHTRGADSACLTTPTSHTPDAPRPAGRVLAA